MHPAGTPTEAHDKVVFSPEAGPADRARGGGYAEDNTRTRKNERWVTLSYESRTKRKHIAVKQLSPLEVQHAGSIMRGGPRLPQAGAGAVLTELRTSVDLRRFFACNPYSYVV